MTLKEAKKRIEELERKVLELQLRPSQQIHYHYQTPYYPWWQQYQNPYVGLGVPYWGAQGAGISSGTTGGAGFGGSLVGGQNGLQMSNS